MWKIKNKNLEIFSYHYVENNGVIISMLIISKTFRSQSTIILKELNFIKQSLKIICKESSELA